MNWRDNLLKNVIQSLICIVLSMAIALSMFFPALSLRTVLPEKPAASEDIQEITVLKVGENAENINTIVVPGSNVSESDDTEQQETDGTADGEKTPQNTDKKDKSDKKNEDKEKEEEKTEADEPNTGDGNQGQEDGNQGEEGGDFAQIDIAMVMTWYKYGSDPKTIICNPSDTVSKDLNVAQLQDNVLKFDFAPAGEEAEYMDIVSVTVAEGDGEYKEVEKSDKITINIPEGTKVKNYTFKVSAKYSKRNAKNELEEKATTFTYILKCSHALDLELELNWKEVNDGQTAITCAADKKIPKTVNSSTLVEGSQFNYSTKLTGALKDKAQITKAEYRAGTALPVGINAGNGMVLMEANPDTKEKTYLFTFTVDVQDKDGSTSTVTYTFEIVYKKSMDVKLNFVWMEGGSIPVSHTCLPQETISMSVKNNQLSAGSVIYEMKLDGADAANARILNISYISDGSGGGTLEESGSLPMSMPDGYAYNTYTITVNAMVDGQRITFTVKLKYVMDVSLRMVYTVGGEQKIIECENGKTVTPKEEIYDDQLSDGKLVYQMELTGDEAAGAQITDITCFQSGSGRTIALSKSGSGEVKLLLKDGKTGENTFTVQATDSSGKIYEFKINIPYKHRGENPVFFEVSVKDGDVLINETINNINVRAWSEDGNGNVLSHILATGIDTKLIVKFDGEELRYVSTSGVSQEYEVYPENPEEEDTNTHKLYIYAEDEFGNYGEKEIPLTGRRAMEGNKTGTATILVDMTVLGINEIFRVDYDVLAGEMASHVVAKAVLGEDLGEPYGKAKDSLGWSGKYDGSYDVGFYLKSLTPGVNANTLEDTTWPGNSEEEVLQAIDNRFGKGSGLATLWRCIYRNGLTKAGGSGTSFGEHDYAQGSGWSYALDGTYYPGKGMSTSDIKAGQTLTLRYTLAYGWDIGGGTEGYGIDKNVGYCVKAINGYFDINHKMENKTLANGKTVYMCKCCGLIEDCGHTEKVWTDMGDGWHILVCADVKCGAQIGDPKKHEWTFDVANGDTYHTCKDCKLEEKHNMLEVEGSNTAGCTTAGERTVECSVCSKIRVEDAAANGHTLGGTWYKDKDGHYQQCKLEDCKAVIEESKGKHNYQYNSSAGWFECNDCGAIHDEFMGDPCDNELTVVSQSCKEIKYHCNECGYDMTRTGTFDYHSFEAGYCVHCGKADGSAGGDSESGSDSESGGDSNSGSDSESGGDSNSGSDSESGGDSNSGSDSESGGDSNSSSDSEVGGDSGSSSDSEVGGDSGSSSDSEAGGDSGSSSDSEAGGDSGSSSNSEPVGEPSSETGSGPDGENIEIT